MKLTTGNAVGGLTVGIALLAAAIVVYQNSNNQKEIAKIQIRGRTVYAEVARENEAHVRGLSQRPGICSDCGMIFIFSEKERHSFWMKEMRFDLDIIWIRDNEIIGIEKGVSHDQKNTRVLRPAIEVDKVLEVRAGLSDEWGIAAGDRVTF